MKRNNMQLIFDAKSENERFARVAVAAFLAELNPTLDEIADVKTAVSEAVTNAIIHGYAVDQESLEESDKQVELVCKREGTRLEILVIDRGVGIADVKKAREPFFTTKPDMDRSGMGFVFMETFMDEIEVESKEGEGTTVRMIKYITGEREK